MTTNELAEGIRTSDRKVLKYIYTEYYPVIEKVIKIQFRGTTEQAKDIFQDALLTIFTGLTSDPPLKINTSFVSFISMICKRRMIDEIRKCRKFKHENEFFNIADDDASINEFIVREEKATLFEKHFNKLGEKCRQLLMLFLSGLSTKEITCKLKMSSEQFTKKRKLQCKISLFKSLFTDSTLKELIDGKPWNVREIPKW